MNEVKTPKKPLIYYYSIALLILLLFNFLAMPWLAQRQIREVDYNTFVTMLEDGQVGLVQPRNRKTASSSRTGKRPPCIRPPWWATRT